MTTIEQLDPESRAARKLISASDQYMAALYPAGSNHGASIESLGRPNAQVFGAYLDDELAGIGAVITLDGDIRYGEIKRLFVPEAHRGKGLSKALMQSLEDFLRATGIPVARLETGIHQPEALGLYRRLGYRERTPFGNYRPDPLSLFMEKHLGPR